MQEELKIQEELKKVLDNSAQAVTTEELSDEQLESVAGGEEYCYNYSRRTYTYCTYNSTVYNANDLE